MANINEYPINFSYGEKTVIDGVPYTHRGNDLPLWFEPVIIKGTQIGISGDSGKAVGPHVHVQAGRDESAQQTIDSKPYIGSPGTVFKTGTASEWGKYVCVRVGDVNVFYCHLSRIDVKLGQQIGGAMNPNKGDVDNIVGELWGRKPNPEDYGFANGNWHDFVYGLINAYPYQDRKKNFAQAIEDAKRYKKEAETNGGIAGIRGDRLNALATALGAKDGDDLTMFDKIEALKKAAASGGGGDSALDKDTNTKVNQIWNWFKQLFNVK